MLSRERHVSDFAKRVETSIENLADGEGECGILGAAHHALQPARKTMVHGAYFRR
jgi:hypothetical protein